MNILCRLGIHKYSSSSIHVMHRGKHNTRALVCICRRCGKVDYLHTRRIK